MATFAIVILGLGLITLGASLIASTVWQVEIPSGIAESTIVALGLVGKWLAGPPGPPPPAAPAADPPPPAPGPPPQPPVAAPQPPVAVPANSDTAAAQ